MKVSEIKKAIGDGAYKNSLCALYACEKDACARIARVADEFIDYYGDLDGAVLLSTPGRTEICGNHTDHNNGKVAAASVSLDVIGIAARTDDKTARVKSQGFDEDAAELSSLSVRPEEKSTSAALVRGVAAGLSERGYAVGGIRCCTASNVLKGSGLSSSAAFEVEIGKAFGILYNNDSVDPVTLAKVGQYAENEYYGKPCGLMDQTACAVGGFTSLDFEDTSDPKVKKLPVDLAEWGLSLCVIDTGGNHADLTPDYGAIPFEMKSVARYFGSEVLRFVDENKFWNAIPELRAACGDRAIMRAAHYFGENKRVEELTRAVEARDGTLFCKIVQASGLSSFHYNQNVYSAKNPDEQGITLAYLIAERVLGDSGSYRVQGGGFAGTLQAFVPVKKVPELRAAMTAVFGERAFHEISIRNAGTVELVPD